MRDGDFENDYQQAGNASNAIRDSDLLGVFDRGRVAIVMDGTRFLGLITRTDLLSYLRLHMPKAAAPVDREFS